jgi:hypothetical protein
MTRDYLELTKCSKDSGNSRRVRGAVLIEDGMTGLVYLPRAYAVGATGAPSNHMICQQ